MKDPLIINIQKCSIHDGPGIRTTVFFKGCPLECKWCHNPESQSYTREVLYNEEKCSRCEACLNKCPHDAIYKEDNNIYIKKDECQLCETCLDYCLNNAREIVGSTYKPKDLIKEIEKDMIFYEESGGGITLSGGEVMAQNIGYIENIASVCKDKGISVVIDTCGYVKFENYEKILPYVDLFLYDIKLIDDEKHKKFTGKSNDLILANLKNLSKKNANINVRIPLIEGVNVDEDNVEVLKIIEFLKDTNVRKVNLLPYHNIGMHKYKKLYKEYEGLEFKKPSENKLEEIKYLFEKNNFETKIGG